MLKNKLKNRGITLIETLVSLMIFTIVALTAVTILVNAVKAERYQYSVQALQDNARYIMEAMVKEIRMSRAIALPNCGGVNGCYSSSPHTLQVTNQDGNDVTYVFDGSNLTRDSIIINSANVIISGSFFIFNHLSSQQPRVTIQMEIKPAGGATTPIINLQNTVSLRTYE